MIIKCICFRSKSAGDKDMDASKSKYMDIGSGHLRSLEVSTVTQTIRLVTTRGEVLDLEVNESAHIMSCITS